MNFLHMLLIVFLLSLAGCASGYKTSDHPETIEEKAKVDLYGERTRDNFRNARIAFEERDYETSLELRKKNLEISEEMFGNEGRGVGVANYFIGEILTVQGKYNQAIPYLERAVRVMSIRFGKSHQYTRLAAKQLKDTTRLSNK